MQHLSLSFFLSFFPKNGPDFFSYVDFFTAQITEEHVQKKKTEKALVEIGPRFVLNPVKILSGSFGGAVLFENPHYISPNIVRLNEFLLFKRLKTSNK
jgi:ribosome biogenesis protein BRX1